MLLVKTKLLRQLAAVVETGNWLWLKLCLKNRAAARTLPGRIYRDYVYLLGGQRWPAQDIWQLFPESRKIRVTLEYLPPSGISTPADQLLYLALITKVLAPRRIFEIGTFRGRTTLNFALNSPSDCVIYTLDLPPEQRGEVLKSPQVPRADKKVISASETGADYRGSEVEHKIVQLYGDSRVFDFSPYYRQMDLVFVDALKHYAAVRQDTENALEMIKAGGAIIWHGFANYGAYNDVTRAVLDCLPPRTVIQVANTELALYLSMRRPACTEVSVRVGASEVRT